MAAFAKEKLPTLFLELSAKGCFDSSAFLGMEVVEDGGYLWFCDMEWMPLESILRCEQLDGQDSNVIPFARTSGGDLWAWYDLDNPPCPVVFCPHDDSEGTFYAPSFAGALFRQILEFASQNNFCEGEGQDWELALPVARQHLQRWKGLLARDFPGEWIGVLDRLLVADLHSYQEGDRPSSRDYLALITPEESHAIVRQHLLFDRFDTSFEWISD